MANAGRSIELENALCEIFDIDPSKTHTVSVTLSAGHLGVVRVERYLQESEIGPLIEALGKHSDHFKVETVHTMGSRRSPAVRKHPAKN